MQAARGRGRYGSRDAAMILVAYRHGLRVAELVRLRWEQIDFAQGLLHVRRVKNEISSVHPLHGPELRALRQSRRETGSASYVFMTERDAPMTPAGFRKLLARIGQVAGFDFPVHPHMLRHACGYKLANDGHDTRAIQHYLGHKNIAHTVRYTELSPDRFREFWNEYCQGQSGLSFWGGLRSGGSVNAVFRRNDAEQFISTGVECACQVAQKCSHRMSLGTFPIGHHALRDADCRGELLLSVALRLAQLGKLRPKVNSF